MTLFNVWFRQEIKAQNLSEAFKKVSLKKARFDSFTQEPDIEEQGASCIGFEYETNDND